MSLAQARDAKHLEKCIKKNMHSHRSCSFLGMVITCKTRSQYVLVTGMEILMVSTFARVN